MVRYSRGRPGADRRPHPSISPRGLIRMEDSYQLCSAPEYAEIIRRAFEIRLSGGEKDALRGNLHFLVIQWLSRPTL